MTSRPSSKNFWISIPEAAGSALSTRIVLSFALLLPSPVSLSFSLSLVVPLSPSRRSFRSSARVSRPGQAEAFGSARVQCASVYTRALLPHVCASGYAYKSGPPAREMYSEAEVASTYRRTFHPFPTPFLPRDRRRQRASLPFRFPPLFNSHPLGHSVPSACSLRSSRPFV